MHQNSERKCNISDIEGRDGYTARPADHPALPSPNVKRTSTFVPLQPNLSFIGDCINQVRTILYGDKDANSEARKNAAFRYKILFLEKEEVEANVYI